MNAQTKSRWARFFFLVIATTALFLLCIVLLIPDIVSGIDAFLLSVIFLDIALYSIDHFCDAGLSIGYLGRVK